MGGSRWRFWRVLRVAARDLRRRWRLVEFKLARQFGLATRADRQFFLLVPLIGVIAGSLGVVVHGLIDGLRRLLWGADPSFLAAATEAEWWWRVGACTLGGLAVSVVVWLGKEPVGGHGMSLLIESVARRGGEVPARPVILRAIAAVLTVGAGGSLGREGPMIRLGAMISSTLGRRFRLPPHRVKILLGCGAAAGLAAAYNIPVGGALFAMEVILGNFALEIFGPIVVSSVISTLIVRAVEGNLLVYPAPGFELESLWEIVAYAGLGLVGAVSSVVFVWAVRGGVLAFGRLRFLPPALRPALGMAMLGGLAVAYPQVLGSGVETATLAVAGQLSLGLLLVLPAAKLLATALTAGGGGAGGLFTPSLTFGALVGSAYGYGIHHLFPGTTASYGAYAAVGMAAIAAGTSHAPISAILILFEFTGNYDLILPLMVAAILSSLVSRRLYPYSIYVAPLRREGVEVAHRMEEAVLAGLAVGDLLRQDRDVLAPATPYKEVVARFLGTRRSRLFVVADGGRLVGSVSLHDIKHALDDPGTLMAVVAHDLATPIEATLVSSQRLHEAAEEFARWDFERLPVLDEAGAYQGFLAKKDLLAVYAQEVLGRPAMLATFVAGNEEEAGRDYVELPPDYSVRAVPVPPALVGRTLAEARLPQRFGVRVLEIRRRLPDGETTPIIPEAATILGHLDEIVVLGPDAAVERLRHPECCDTESDALIGLN